VDRSRGLEAPPRGPAGLHSPARSERSRARLDACFFPPGPHHWPAPLPVPRVLAESVCIGYRPDAKGRLSIALQVPGTVRAFDVLASSAPPLPWGDCPTNNIAPPRPRLAADGPAGGRRAGSVAHLGRGPRLPALRGWLTGNRTDLGLGPAAGLIVPAG